jgi:hypothetical protein
MGRNPPMILRKSAKFRLRTDPARWMPLGKILNLLTKGYQPKVA